MHIQLLQGYECMHVHVQLLQGYECMHVHVQHLQGYEIACMRMPSFRICLIP